MGQSRSGPERPLADAKGSTRSYTVMGSRPGAHRLTWGASDRGAACKGSGCRAHTQPETRKGCAAVHGEGEGGVAPSVSEEEGGDQDANSSEPQL